MQRTTFKLMFYHSAQGAPCIYHAYGVGGSAPTRDAPPRKPSWKTIGKIWGWGGNEAGGWASINRKEGISSPCACDPMRNDLIRFYCTDAINFNLLLIQNWWWKFFFSGMPIVLRVISQIAFFGDIEVSF